MGGSKVEKFRISVRSLVEFLLHSGDIDRDCVICSGMAGVMDALYRSMNEECAAYLSHITITDIETQLFEHK